MRSPYYFSCWFLYPLDYHNVTINDDSCKRCVTNLTFRHWQRFDGNFWDFRKVWAFTFMCTPLRDTGTYLGRFKRYIWKQNDGSPGMHFGNQLFKNFSCVTDLDHPLWLDVVFSEPLCLLVDRRLCLRPWILDLLHLSCLLWWQEQFSQGADFLRRY